MVKEKALKKLRPFYSNKYLLFGLGLCCLVGSFLYKFNIAKESISLIDYDEYFTVRIALGTFEGASENSNLTAIWNNANIDNGNNVLYNFFAIFIAKVFGNEELNLRLFSLFFHFLTVALSIHILLKRKVALPIIVCTIFFISFHPTLNQFSTVIRAYSMLAFEALFLYYLCYEVRRSKIQSILVTLTILSLVFTHYLSIFFILGIGLDQAIQEKKVKCFNVNVVPFWIAGVLIIIYFSFHLDWFIHINEKNEDIQQLAHSSRPPVTNRRSLGIFSLLEGTTEFLSIWMLSVGYLGKLASGVFPFIGKLVFNGLNVIFLAYVFFKSQKSMSRIMLIIILLGLIFPLIMVVISGHLTALTIKYNIAFIIVFIILFSQDLGLLNRGTRLIFVYLGFNIILNLTVSTIRHQTPKMTLLVDQKASNFSQESLDDLRRLVSERQQSEGCINYNTEEEYRFIKTLMNQSGSEIILVHSQHNCFVSPPLLK